MNDNAETANAVITFAPVKSQSAEIETSSGTNLTHTILKSSTIVIVVTLIQKFLGLLLFRALALHYSPTAFGDWNTAAAFISFFTIITDGGIDSIVVREASKKRPNLSQFIGTAILAKLFLSLLSLIICVIIVFITPYLFNLKLLIILCAIPMLFNFNSVYGDILQAELKIWYTKLVGIVFSILMLAGGFLVIWLNGDLFALELSVILAGIPTIFMYQSMTRFIIKPNFHIDFKLFKELFREALPLAFSGLFGVIYYRIDAVLLSIIDGSAAVAYYSATYKLTEVLNILPGAVMIPLFPLFSRYMHNSVYQQRLATLYHTSFRFLLAIILPTVIGTTVLADQIILSLYAPSYLPASNAMRLIIWAEIPMFISPVVYLFVIADGRQTLLTKAAFVMALFNIISNLILIPIMSFYGSALATSLTEFLGLSVGLWYIKKHYQLGHTPKIVALVISLIPFSCCLVLVPITGNILFAVLACIIYVGLVIVTKVVDLNELRNVLLKRALI